MARWFPIGKEGAIKAYESQADCEADEGQACYDIGEDEPSDYDLVDGAAVLNDSKKTGRLAASAAEVALQARVSKFTKAQRVIALIGLRNEAKNLTSDQVVSVLTTYQSILLMLLSLSIPTARAMVVAAAVDGTIMTEADRTAILAEIDA